MSKLIPFCKKFTLAALVLAIGLAALPAASACAAGLQDQSTPPGNQAAKGARLEQAWARAQVAYQHQGGRLAKADAFIARAQTLIDKATQKGWEPSALQAALAAFDADLSAAQAAHAPGAAIIASHTGFDAAGKITDRRAAITTVKFLGQVLKHTRTALNGTGQTLREAVKAFRAAHKPPTP